MISGTEGNYDLILRTGAWGKDIIVPTAIAGVLTAGVTTIPAAAGSQVIEHMHLRNISGTTSKRHCLTSEAKKQQCLNL